MSEETQTTWAWPEGIPLVIRVGPDWFLEGRVIEGEPVALEGPLSARAIGVLRQMFPSYKGKGL